MLQKTSLEITLEEGSRKCWLSKIAQMLRLRIVWQGLLVLFALLVLLVLLVLLATPAFLVGTSNEVHATTPVSVPVSTQAMITRYRLPGGHQATASRLKPSICFYEDDIMWCEP